MSNKEKSNVYIDSLPYLILESIFWSSIPIAYFAFLMHVLGII